LTWSFSQKRQTFRRVPVAVIGRIVEVRQELSGQFRSRVRACVGRGLMDCPIYAWREARDLEWLDPLVVRSAPFGMVRV